MRVQHLLVIAAALAGCTSSVDGSRSSARRRFVAPPEMALAPVAPPVWHSRRLAPIALPTSRAAPVRRPFAPTAQTLRARVLVLSADGSEATLPAIRQILDVLGTPYDVYVATQTPHGLTADRLANGADANYQAVILATGELAYFGPNGWGSALADDEWATLWDFESAFGVRQATFYAYPQPSYGMNWPNGVIDTSPPGAGFDARFTPSGAALFGYLNTDNPIRVQWATVYLAQPMMTPAAGVSGTEVELADAAGNAVMLVTRYADGREGLALTFDGNPYLVHTLALSYGIVNWVTRGLFIGERHEVMAAQVDDVLIDDDVWQSTDSYRIDAPDVAALVRWQNLVRQDPSTPDLALSLAFNGAGAGADPLTAALVDARASFSWISHTFSHLNLDTNEDGTPVTYAEVVPELSKNDAVAANVLELGSDLYNPEDLVTPDVSGLTSPAAMQAAYDRGVRFVVSDTSRIAGFASWPPNVGSANAEVPGILEIPRRPTNLFYNVTTPAEWVGEYNQLYGANGIIAPPAGLGFDSTYDQILDRESDTLASYLLRGSQDPWMFHEANLRAYDGVHSLLGDLIDRTLAKYHSYMRLPIASPSMDDLGLRCVARAALDAAGVQATIRRGQSITVQATGAAVVPLTGVGGAGSEEYGGQSIAHVSLTAGQSVTLPLP